MKKVNLKKQLLNQEFFCNVSVLKDCVEKNDYFSIFFNAKIRIQKIAKNYIIIEILNKTQQLESYYLNNFLECLESNSSLDVILNDNFQIISIKNSI